MKYKTLYELLAPLDLNGCNGNFERLVNQRMQALCDIKNCEMADLTLREAIGCFEASQLDYNEQSPRFFSGMPPRPISEVTQDHLGAIV